MAEEQSPFEALREEHAQRVGVEADKVELVRLELDILLERGTLVDLDVHGVSMFTTRATWKELGVPESAVRRARFTRGGKGLLPRGYIRAFKSLEARARQCLDRHSFVVEGFHPFRWIPFTSYAKWRGMHGKIVQEWDELKEKLLEGYDEQLIPLLEGDFTQIGEEAWMSLGRHGQERDDMGQEAFVAGIVAAARRRMPTKEEIRSRLRIDYRTAALVSPTLVERELAHRDQIREEREIARQQARLETARVEAERVEEEARRQAALEEARQQERLLREMREAELAHYRRQLAEMTSPIAGVFAQLRDQMLSDARAVLETMRRNKGQLIGPAVRRARGMVETFQVLNATGDQELQELLNQMEGFLDQDPGEQRTVAVRQVLHNITSVASQEAVGVRELIQRGRFATLRPWREEEG